MRQIVLLTLALCGMFSIANAADSSMSITTAKAVGETIKIALKAENANTIVQIDYGDGVLIEKTIGTSGTDVSGTLKGSNVIVYGEGIIWFYCDSNELTEVDVSNYPTLLGLNCNNNDLVSLDLSQNVELHLLYCADNELTSLDLSNNEDLTTLRCYGNQLASLNLTKALDYLRCYNNKLDFASVPVVKGSFKVYEYAPQADVEINETINDGIVDLSSQYNIEGNPTAYIWKTESGTVLTEGVDYNFEEGVTTFLTTPTEKVYCEMTNDFFPDFTGENVLKTTKAMVGSTPPEGVPAITLTTANEIGETIDIALSAEIDATSIFIDYGDGNLIAKMINISETDVSGTLVGSTINIYGAGIVLLKSNENSLSILDVSNCPTLMHLECVSNALTQLDLTNNDELITLNCRANNLNILDITKCKKLVTLNCRTNRLKSLDLSNKTHLRKLECSWNNLKSLNLSSMSMLDTLQCGDNWLLSLDLRNNPMLIYLDCSYNNLESLDLSANPNLERIHSNYNCLTDLDVSNNLLLNFLITSNNQLTSLSLNSCQSLIRLDCNSNELTTLDLSGNLLLEWLDCHDNELTSLDVSNNTMLEAIYCRSNELVLLDLNNNTMLKYLNCSSNDLVSLNINNCRLLERLNCEYNGISSLDVNNNTMLKLLNCSANNLISLEVINCKMLMSLLCQENELTSLDLSNNVLLETIYCYTNQINTLDVNGCYTLYTLYCHENLLTSLDISESVNDIRCSNNRLTFVTLPLEPFLNSSLVRYYYFSQADININSTVDISSEVDLSDQYDIDDNITNYIWKTESGSILSEGIDYDIDNGITKFLNIPSENVYCEMTNSTFPNLILKTTLTEVVESPIITTGVESAVKVYVGDNSISVETEVQSKVEIFDTYGVPIVSKEIDAGYNTINGISGGFYVVRVSNENGSSSQKVVVK